MAYLRHAHAYRGPGSGQSPASVDGDIFGVVLQSSGVGQKPKMVGKNRAIA